MKNLLEIAHRSVPHYMWEYTPITLKATAGLRLLPGDMAEDILTEVNTYLIYFYSFLAFAMVAISCNVLGRRYVAQQWLLCYT